MLKNQTQTGFGATIGSMCSAFDINTKLPRQISKTKAKT